MTLDPRQRLELLAADGLLSDEDVRHAAALGVDLDAAVADGQRLRQATAAALRGGPAPDLAASVMESLGLASCSDAVAQALADAHDAPDMAGDVMRALGLPTGSADVADALRDSAPAPNLVDGVLSALGIAGTQADIAGALADPRGAPDITADVMVALGLDDASAHVAAALADDQPAPDLADGVMAALGLASSSDIVRTALADPAGAPDLVAAVMSSVDATDDDVVVPLQPLRVAPPAAHTAPPQRLWTVPAAVMAAAAALMLTVQGLPHGPQIGPASVPLAAQTDDGGVFELAAVNDVEIEELMTDTEAMVQVIQFEADAPTIIFIEDLSSPDDGATL